MPHHAMELRVFYEDTDAVGVMYHARYLSFAERGRTEAMRAFGAPVSGLLEQHGLSFLVSDLRIAYRRALHLDDLVTVTTSLSRLGAVRCRLRQTIGCVGTVGADMEVTLACIRVSDLRPARIPSPWRDVLERLGSAGDEQFVA